jgi:hypothetical protein
MRRKHSTERHGVTGPRRPTTFSKQDHLETVRTYRLETFARVTREAILMALNPEHPDSCNLKHSGDMLFRTGQERRVELRVIPDHDLDFRFRIMALCQQIRPYDNAGK